MEPASGSAPEVQKLDKKALEGLDARTESTKVPDEDMEEFVEGPPSIMRQHHQKTTRVSRNTREAL